MNASDVRFAGSIPANYDRFLGPLFLTHYAADLAGRLPVARNARILELACGTGILTSALRRAMRPDSHLTATDLNPPMLEYAQSKTGSDSSITWKLADALALPFPDGSFDAVACQFGVMFFPDKATGIREMMRVLVPGGSLAFNTWDSIERNGISKVILRTVTRFIPQDSQQFLPVPFSCCNCDEMRHLLQDAGADGIQIHVVEYPTAPAAVDDIATGMVEGTPLANALTEKGVPLSEVQRAVSAELQKEFGEDPITTPTQALVYIARKKA